MPIGKRSPSRSSNARKVNAVVSPIGDDKGVMDTQRSAVSKSGIIKTARATGSKHRARKTTSTTEGIRAVKSIGVRSERATNNELTSSTSSSNKSATDRSTRESFVGEKLASSRSPGATPESNRATRLDHATQHARERAAQRREDADDMAFFGRSHGHVHALEEVGQDLAEQFLTGVTSGQEAHGDAQDRIWEMELGGPFVISSDKRELGRGRRGMDGFESEAFPTPSAPPSVPAADAWDDEEEDEY